MVMEIKVKHRIIVTIETEKIIIKIEYICNTQYLKHDLVSFEKYIYYKSEGEYL